MFIIEALHDGAWTRDGGDYFCHDNAAIVAAKKKQEKDGNERRVMTWPAPEREVWPTVQQPTSEAA